MAQDGPKMAHDGQGWHQDGPRCPKVAARWPNMAADMAANMAAADVVADMTANLAAHGS